MNKYDYVDTTGKVMQTEANTPEEALKLAPNIASDSGVSLNVSTPNTPPSNPAIVSTRNQWGDFNSATSGLNTLLNTADPYAQLFAQQIEQNKLASENAIASATAAKERAIIKNESDRNATVAGLETYAAKTGMAPNSEYHLQVIQNAKDNFNNKYSLIDRDEKLAIAKAKAAQSTGDLKVLKEQLNYAKLLRNEKAKALEAKQKLDLEEYKFKNMTPYQKEMIAIARQKANTNSVRATKEVNEKPLPTSSLNFIKKQNPLLDFEYGTTQKDFENTQNLLNKIQQKLNTDENMVNGYYTYEFIKGLNDVLPQGISKVELMKSIKDKLAIGNVKKAKEYGITAEELKAINEE